MANCPLCGKRVVPTSKNVMIVDGQLCHKKCPKSKPKIPEQELDDFKSLKDRIAYHCNNNARGFVADNGMNFLRAIKVVKDLHDKDGYTYSEIEYALDKTVEQMGGFWGIGQVPNRIEPIIAKKRELDKKREDMKLTNVEPVVVDLSKLLQDDDEW